jgi:CheY-like chemotaxis protein
MPSDLERQIAERTAELSRANAALQHDAADARRQAELQQDEFLAVLGHELRNPLSAIAGAIQVLMLTGSPDGETREMLTIIERQSAQMSRLIDDLLDVSRISRGKINIRPERLDLVQLVRQTAGDVRCTFAEGQVELQLVAPELPIYVSGDPTRLAQALVNLLLNAAKFSNSGGRVTVSVESYTAMQTAGISVRDTGIGIAAEDLARIFEPGMRAQTSPEHSRGGLGLGLAIVKGLVELHGGRVSAQSAGLDQGAEFSIQLPLDGQAQLVSTVEPSAMPSLQRLRILIIDDQRDASYPMRKLLERAGHEVTVACEGLAGLEAARSLQPQLVLCDIGLPGGMNGYSVAEGLRADPRTRSAYLVAVTGYGQEEDRRKAVAAGFDRHLTKPVGHAELSALLASLSFPGISG